MTYERPNRAKMALKILQTHTSLRMREETLFLATYIMDKYMSIKPVRTKDLDLFLVAVIFIAAKYEETTYVRLYRIIAGYSNYRFEPTQVIHMEAEILGVLDFKLNIICPYDFLKRLFLIHKIDDKNLSELTSCLLQFRVGSNCVFGKMPLLHQFGKSSGRL